jgi:ribosomal protein L11 methyltransferase
VTRIGGGGGGACVVLAAGNGSSREVEAWARGVEAAHEPWEEIRPGRLVTRLWFDDDASARSAVTDLRAAGHPAVLGPPDSAHEVGWLNRNRPTVIDDRLVVCFPWAVAPPESELVVEIDPGVGFGTGDHPSTRLLLGVLVQRMRGGERVADIGCGSGVLAIAAAALGAESVVGVDINAEGLRAAEANSVRNGCADRARFSTMGVEQLAAGAAHPFDVVLANIHAPILADMAEHLTRLTATGGWLALSGISPAQVSRLTAAFPDVHFEEHVDGGEWSALVGRHRG